MTDRRSSYGALAVLLAFAAVLLLPPTIALVVVAAMLVPVGLAVGLRIEPGLLLALALAGTMLSGLSGHVGLPISPDRPFFALALLVALGGGPVGRSHLRQVRWRSVHTWMIITIAVMIVLGVAAGSFETDLGRWALVDRVGVVPYLSFVIAPLIYTSARQRSYLLAVLVGVGWYLGVTALLEGFGAKELAWPAYINDPSVGLHFERARGPFAEATIMGAALLGCLVACVIALRTWRSRGPRWAAGALVPVLLLGAVFTLTRAVWLAAAAAAAVGILADRRSRRFLLPVTVLAVVSVALALVAVPGLSNQVTERRREQIAVWDRLNTNAAAWDALIDNPLTGVGWARFAQRSGEYLEQNPDYPLTGNRIEVHNIVLSRLAEVGLLGTLPWLVALLLGVAVPALAKRPAWPELEPWRHGLLMYGTAFAVLGMFGPLSGAFPNLLLWLYAGVVAIPMTSRPRPIDETDEPMVLEGLPG